MKRRMSLPLIVVAAGSAVGFWSLKPIFISLIGDRSGYAEVFLVAGAIASIASLLGMLVFSRSTLELLKNPRSYYGIGQAAISGFFLAMWYYGFYRALYGAEKVDATIIAFSWPLISVIAMRIFAPSHGKPLEFFQYGLIGVAFLGAVSIGLANISGPSFMSGGGEIAFAFVAAIGSGFYLPFAVKSINHFGEIIGSKVLASFYTISVANLVSLLAVGLLIFGTRQQLYFYAYDAETIIICALIGLGTYLVAEITWTWAFSEYDSLTLSSLPYFSPAISVVLLFIFFNEPVQALAAFGLVLILFANMTLHGMYKSNNAIIMSLIGTTYIALLAQIIHPISTENATDLLFAISGLFAILAGFILARVSSRRAQELDARAQLVRRVLALSGEGPAHIDTLDELVQAIVDVEFLRPVSRQDAAALDLRMRIAGNFGSGGADVLAAFDAWYTIHRDRLSYGEMAALWITGAGSILFLMLVRDDSAIGLIGLYAFSAGCLLVMFAIHDYEQNNFHGFRSQVQRIQQGFLELGRPYYLPEGFMRSREYGGLPQGVPIRFRSADGKVETSARVGQRSGFPILHWLSGALLVCTLVLLPFWSQAQTGQGAQRIIRPEILVERVAGVFQSTAPDMTVARFDWDASQVAAEIISQIVRDAHGITVAVRDVHVDEALSMMADPNGSLDVHPDLWVENQPDSIERYVKDSGPVALGRTAYSGRQGIYLERRWADKLDIRTLGDLTKPETARLFDENGNGKGEIWLGAGRWLSTEIMRQLLEESGLNGLWEGQVYSDRILKAKLENFHRNDRPLLFYGYEPDWIHSEFDLVDITEPSGHNRIPMGDDCQDDRPPALCAFKSVGVHIAFRRSLFQSRPEVASTLQAIRFRTEDVNHWLRQTTRDGHAPSSVAATWVKENRALIEEWSGSGTPTVEGEVR